MSERYIVLVRTSEVADLTIIDDMDKVVPSDWDGTVKEWVIEQLGTEEVGVSTIGGFIKMCNRQGFDARKYWICEVCKEVE